MIEKMKIGVLLEVTGNGQRLITQFNRAVLKVTESLEVLNRRLTITGDKLTSVATKLEKLNPGMAKFSEGTGAAKTAFGGLSTQLSKGTERLSALNGRLISSSTRMDAAADSAKVLADSLTGVAESGAAASASMAGLKASRMGGAGSGGKKGGGHGGFHTERFRAGPVGYSFGASPLAIGATVAGFGAYESLKTYNEYQQQESQLTLQNLPGYNQADLSSFIGGQHLRGVSQTDLLKSLADAAVITKDYAEAKSLAPLMASMTAANRVIYGSKFTDAQEMALIKAAEIQTNSKDPAVLRVAFQHMQKVLNASSGRVLPDDYRQAAAKVRGAAFNFDPDFFYYKQEPFIQEYGGAKVGVMDYQFLSHIVAGKLTTPAAQFLKKVGLVKPGGYVPNKIGMLKKIIPGGVKGTHLAGKDIDKWVQTYWLPHLIKAGYNTPELQHQAAYIVFTNTDSTIVNGFVDQQAKIQKNFVENKRAAGINQTQDQAFTMVGGKAKILTADIETLMKQIGHLLAGPAAFFIEFLDKIISKLSIVIQNMQAAADWFKSKTGYTLMESIEGKGLADLVKKHFAPPAGINGVSAGVSSAVTAAAQPQQGVINLDGHQVGSYLFGGSLTNLFHQQQLGSTNSFSAGLTPITPDAPHPF